MVTIREVAKFAGVSHGTVSNVINGATNVSVEKIRKVKAAMAELGYKPNMVARNLKKEHTKEINIILPNNKNSEYIELYESLNGYAKRAGYFVYPQFTDEVPTEERRLLNEALMRNVEGVILVTCQPNNEEFFEKIIKAGLNIVFVHHEVVGGKYNYAGFDVEQVVSKAIRNFINEKIDKIGLISGPKEYTFEANVLNGYFGTLLEAGITIEPMYVENTGFGESSVFRSAMRMLQLKERPGALLLSNNSIAKCVRKAIEIICDENEEPPRLFVLQPYDWIEYHQGETISLPFYQLARNAFNMLMRSIEKKGLSVQKDIVKVGADNRIYVNEGVKEGGERLRILLNESPSSSAVQLLLPDFKKKTGIDVKIVTKPYAELFNEIWQKKGGNNYDIYSIDFPWLKDLAFSGALRCVDDLYALSGNWFNHFLGDVLDKSLKVEGSYYAAPYSFTVQLLFWRRDLFNKLENQRLYYDWYKEELRIPTTWEEFNRIAKLFTRKYNPASDTEYGVTLGGKASSGAINEYLPRMHAFGGKIFDKGGIKVNCEESQKALANYIESYKYANPKAVNWWWNEQVEEYCLGNAAMMTMYTEHVSHIEDRKFSKVVGKTEAAVLPGRHSVLGGWALGINKNSEKVDAAYEFMKWISGDEMLGPCAALGRILPNNTDAYKALIANEYSWFGTAWEAFRYTKSREVPNFNGKPLIMEPTMENVLGNAVHKAIKGEMEIREALNEAKRELEGLAKEKIR